METIRKTEENLSKTLFQNCFRLAGLSIFCVLIAIHLVDRPNVKSADWYWVFSPLFCADMFCAYYVVVVTIRRVLEWIDVAFAIFQLFWNFSILSTIVWFKIYWLERLNDHEKVSHFLLVYPIIILTQLFYAHSLQKSLSRSR